MRGMAPGIPPLFNPLATISILLKLHAILVLELLKKTIWTVTGMSKPQRLREEGQCAYCGQHDMLTVDHVIPRCLFDGVRSGVPGDVPKVGACLQCNNLKGADDMFLRDVLVRDLRLTEHPIAQTIRHG